MSSKRAIGALVATGLLVTAALAANVVGPDDEECKAAANYLVGLYVMADDGERPTDEEAVSIIRWPCRFQTKSQVQAYTGEAFKSYVGQAFGKSLDDIINGR
jgi:hypothetical protein